MANSTPRIARIARDDDGEPIGVAVFLKADELADLGVDTTADAMTVAVEDKKVRFQEVDSCRQVNLEIGGETNL